MCMTGRFIGLGVTANHHVNTFPANNFICMGPQLLLPCYKINCLEFAVRIIARLSALTVIYRGNLTGTSEVYTCLVISRNPEAAVSPYSFRQ